MGEYDAKWLSYSSGGIKGRLLFRASEVVFEPKNGSDESVTIPLSKITDVRAATEKDISALKVWLVGPVIGTAWKDENNILLVDYEDEVGIIQHEAFEVYDAEYAAGVLYEIRKASKLGKTAELAHKLSSPKQKSGPYWQCPTCLRLNSQKAKICTRCGTEKP